MENVVEQIAKLIGDPRNYGIANANFINCEVIPLFDHQSHFLLCFKGPTPEELIEIQRIAAEKQVNLICLFLTIFFAIPLNFMLDWLLKSNKSRKRSNCMEYNCHLGVNI